MSVFIVSSKKQYAVTIVTGSKHYLLEWLLGGNRYEDGIWSAIVLPKHRLVVKPNWQPQALISPVMTSEKKTLQKQYRAHIGWLAESTRIFELKSSDIIS